MEAFVIMVAFGGLIVIGFFVMNKIDKCIRERKRENGLPSDEED